jgi:hypothetical protein
VASSDADLSSMARIWVCDRCLREFDTCEDSIGHIDKRGPTSGADGFGYRFCHGTVQVAHDEERRGV